MKKEYIILVVLIAGLSAYLFLKKDNQVHYELPTVPVVDTSQIDRMEIEKAGQKVVLTKEEKGWTLTDKKYPADEAQIKQMLATLKELRLSALVSEAKDLSRYELDKPNAVKITAFAGKEVLRSFFAGKAAPSYHHTFICLDDTNQLVYQANGNFRSQFDKETPEFRDKKVMEFPVDSIKKITLEKQGKVETLVLVLPPKEKSGQNSDSQKTAATTRRHKPFWQTQDGSLADEDNVSNLLTSLSKLECDTFLDETQTTGLDKETPACKILLENDQNFVLNLFEKKDAEEDIKATSSSTPYAFSLTGFKAEDIHSYVDKLLGIKKKERTDSTPN